MVDATGTYARLIGAQLRAQMQYRVSFVLNTLASFFLTLIDFAGVIVLFGRVTALGGWSMWEVALLYGLSSVGFGVAELLSGGLDHFETYIRQGTFDRVLARPLNSLGQVAADGFELRRIGRVAQAVIILLAAFANLTIAWTTERVAVAGMALACSLAIFVGVFVLSAAFCFWTVEGREVMNVFSYGGNRVTSFPLDIFSQWVQRFVVFVLPLAFVSYEPALYVLGKPDPLALPGWAHLLSPVVAVVMLGAAWLAWQQGVRHYQSTGS